MASSFPPADNDNFAVFAGNLREWCEIHYIRVVPSLTLGLVWLFLVVANRADLAVLAQDLGKMHGICLVHGQFLLLSDPGKTPLPVRIAQKSVSLAGIVGEWREICSVREQFLLFVCKRLTKTTVSLKVNRHFVSYDNSCLNYVSRLSHE